MKKNRGYQNKLSAKVVSEDGEISEYEDLLMMTPSKGPHKVDEQSIDYQGLGFFSMDLILNAIESFKNTVVPKIGEAKYEAIEKCIASYTKSSIIPTDEILFLKSTLMKLYDNFENSSSGNESKLLYLERHKQEIKTYCSSRELFSVEDLRIYQGEAQIITTHYLEKFLKYLKEKFTLAYESLTVDTLPLFRGFNNRQYYENENRGSDMLSLYTSSCECEPYFEPSILNSYSISLDVASKFMVAGKHQRRVLLQADYSVIRKNLLCSFINSKAFFDNDTHLNRQFEMIAIANAKQPYGITQRFNYVESYALFDLEKTD